VQQHAKTKELNCLHEHRGSVSCGPPRMKMSEEFLYTRHTL